MIYVILRGRIGNQLFIYAMAKAIQKNKEKIIIDDEEVLKLNWENSLQYYNLNDVEYVHSHKALFNYNLRRQFFILKLYHYFSKKFSYWKKYNFEKKHMSYFSNMGIILCENGYIDFKCNNEKRIIDGYFQSEKYFKHRSNLIKKELMLDNAYIGNYPGLDDIRKRNSICISIKVEHNVGSALYDVCTKEYWQKSIEYIIKNVNNPLFFICSDNVEYVKQNLIDCKKYDVICQSPDYPVHISLAVMSNCKHFIIGNTTFGWWAQYLSQEKNKIVVAPSKWMRIDMPIDIYQDGWYLIDI